MLKRSLFILIASIFTMGTFSQDVGFGYNPGLNPRFGSPSYYNPFYSNPGLKKDKIDFNFTNTTSFTSFSRIGSVFNNTVSPSINYKVSRKFSVQAGVSISYNYFDSKKNEGPYSLYPGTGHSTIGTVWVRGNYMLTRDLSISATGYKQFSIWDKTDNPYYNINGIDNKGIILDVNYSPSRNFNINARFEYNKGNRPYYNNYWIGQDPISPFGPW